MNSRTSIAKKLIFALILTLLPSSFIGANTAHAVVGTGLPIYYKSPGPWTTPPDPFTTGTCHTQTSIINFNWNGSTPGGTCDSQSFTGYAVGYFLSPVTDTITFCEQSDDQFFLKINGTQIISDQGVKAAASGQTCNGTGTFQAIAGASYYIETWIHQASGSSAWRLLWSYTGQSTYVLIPQASLNATTFTLNPTITFTAPTSAVFRSASTLTVRSDTPGKITFFASGKPIPGCKGLVAVISGATYLSTCNYRSSVHGTVPLYITIYPTNGAYVTKSLTTSIALDKRSNSR